MAAREGRSGGGTPSVGVYTGAAAIAVIALTGLEGAIDHLAVGTRPRLGDVGALVAFSQRTAVGTLGTILTDTFLMAVILVFIAGFRQIVTQSRRDLQWLADIGFAAGIAYVVVTLVGDGLNGAIAVDVTVGGGDGTVIQTLTVANSLLFGSIGDVLTALVTINAGHLILLSGALPRWTGRVSLALAVPNLVLVGTAFGGTEPGDFAAVGGWGSVALGTLPWLIWLGVVGVVIIVERHRHLEAAESQRPADAARPREEPPVGPGVPARDPSGI